MFKSIGITIIITIKLKVDNYIIEVLIEVLKKIYYIFRIVVRNFCFHPKYLTTRINNNGHDKAILVNLTVNSFKLKMQILFKKMYECVHCTYIINILCELPKYNGIPLKRSNHTHTHALLTYINLI